MRVRSPWVWVGFAAFVVIAGAILEGLALADSEGLSFSQFFVNINYAWPPIGGLVCYAIGVLHCHFTWHWVPKQMRETCMLCGDEKLTRSHGG